MLGALPGAMAAQTWLATGTATGFAIFAAAALALAGFIQARALNSAQTARWTRARAASEALKAEVYRYIIRVSPYAGVDRAQALLAQLDLVQARAQAQLVDQQTRSADDGSVLSLRPFEEYLTARAEHQANWHRIKSDEHRRQAGTLRILQLIATGIGVIMSALAGFVSSWRLSTWTAAATTIAAALGAHLAATQHQGIAATYAATADQLERLIADIDLATATPEQQSQFVADVERILVAQKERLDRPDQHRADGAGRKRTVLERVALECQYPRRSDRGVRSCNHATSYPRGPGNADLTSCGENASASAAQLHEPLPLGRLRTPSRPLLHTTRREHNLQDLGSVATVDRNDPAVRGQFHCR